MVMSAPELQLRTVSIKRRKHERLTFVQPHTVCQVTDFKVLGLEKRY